MNFQGLYQTLHRNRYYVFSYDDILSFYPEEKKTNLKEMIYRWKKRGWISPLKRELYELTYPEDLVIPDLYVANKLYSPSYVSLETALSHYSIIPEVSMAVTSITTKPTRKFKNKHGLFIYRTLKPKFFTGYYIEKYGEFEIFMAEPEKAVIDYLYFKTYRGGKPGFKDERIDRDAVSRLSRKKLNRYAALYNNMDLKELYAYL